MFSVQVFTCCLYVSAVAFHKVNKFIAFGNKCFALFLCFFKAYSTVFAHKHAAVKRCIFKVSQLVLLIVLRLVYGIIAKQTQFSPFFKAVIIFVAVAVVFNRVYKACLLTFNFQHNIAVFGNNFTKIHIAVYFGKVNTVRSFSLNCSVSCISINTIMNVAVNKQPVIFCANAVAVRLQGNAIAAYNSRICRHTRHIIMVVQQAAFGSNSYVACTGAYVINVNHIVGICCQSLNVNITTRSFCVKRKCIINILLDYINAGMRIEFCIVRNYRSVSNMVNAAATGNINLAHTDIAAKQDITIAGNSTAAAISIANKLNANRVISLQAEVVGSNNAACFFPFRCNSFAPQSEQTFFLGGGNFITYYSFVNKLSILIPQVIRSSTFLGCSQFTISIQV